MTIVNLKMHLKMSTVSASDFKAHCLEYMDTVHEDMIITKHGKPVAKLIPFKEETISLFGLMEGTGTICGDILEPLDEPWEAAST